mgnify:CR=1 FL=1
MLISSGYLVVGLILLIVAADKFIIGAAALAKNLGVSTMLVGLIVVGFGTSAPEMVVSAIASFKGDSGLAMGNAVGSNITNIALVLGVGFVEEEKNKEVPFPDFSEIDKPESLTTYNLKEVDEETIVTAIEQLLLISE